MNLYLLRNGREIGADMYESAVVVAPNEESARLMHPNPMRNGTHWKDDPWCVSMWCLPEEVRVYQIGTANDDAPSCVINSSFSCVINSSFYGA